MSRTGAAAEREPSKERRLIKECKGIGDGRRHLLRGGAGGLAKLASGPGEFARLVAALVRVELDDDHDGVLEAAGTS